MMVLFRRSLARAVVMACFAALVAAGCAQTPNGSLLPSVQAAKRAGMVPQEALCC
jgi:hypothetical protein